MMQYNTNMEQDSYYAYCNAWVFCFEPTYINLDIVALIMADKAGIVFG